MPSETALDELRAACPTISVGILTADLMALGAELAVLEKAGVKLVHIDVMDGCFTPMMTVGPPFIKAMRTSLLKDVHLMIDEPLDKLGDYVAAGADIITVHPEACTHPHRVLQQLGAARHAADPTRPIVRGVALNPGTPLAVLEPLIDEVDLVMLLAVNPGWGRQSFVPATLERVARVSRMASRAPRPVLVAVDGAITRENVATVAAAGADLIVTGSAVFDGRSPAANARFMLERVAAARQRAG